MASRDLTHAQRLANLTGMDYLFVDMNLRARRGLLTCCLLILVLSRAPAQEAVPPVVLSPLVGPDGLSATLADRITDVLELTLRLSATAPLERVDFLTPHIALAPARAYYQRANAELAIYGTVEPRAEGGFVVSVFVWRDEMPNEPEETEYEVARVLDVFEVADELSLQIASDFVGRELFFGDLVIENVDELAEFAVYADDNLVARNERQLRLLSGEREIVIARPGELGDELVERFVVTIPPDGVVTVALTPPEPEPEPDLEPIVQPIDPEPPAPAPNPEPILAEPVPAPDEAVAEAPPSPFAIRLAGGLSTPVFVQANTLGLGATVVLGASFDFSPLPLYVEALAGLWTASGSTFTGSLLSFAGFAGGGVQFRVSDPLLIRGGVRIGYGFSEYRFSSDATGSSASLAWGGLVGVELALTRGFGIAVDAVVAAQAETYYALQVGAGIVLRL